MKHHLASDLVDASSSNTLKKDLTDLYMNPMLEKNYVKC